jgi:prepilin signal peptidase PulO-like enzyme (type II secretory pathway)
MTMRYLMLLEATSFALAALIHAGFLIPGYEHPKARIAEAVIATVLFAGVAIIWARPAATRQVSLGAQGLALLGTLVGVFTIIIGIGPQTMPDIVYHVCILVLLAWGLSKAARLPTSTSRDIGGEFSSK